MAPLFSESDEGALKAWLVRRLVSASEADPDVLADYILALLRHDQGRNEIMQTCISQLADFMSSGANPPSRPPFRCCNLSLVFGDCGIDD
jgi:hypothetical protein